MKKCRAMVKNPEEQLEAIGDRLPLHNAVNRFVGDSLARSASLLAAIERGSTQIPLDVYEEGENVIVKAALPGFKPEQVSIQVQGAVLTIVGECAEDQAAEGRNYQLREHTSGRLERSLLLPVSVAAEKVEAVFTDGILTVTLPKSEEVRVRQIAIKAGAGDNTAASTNVSTGESLSAST
jgi:HSP20 family protein